MTQLKNPEVNLFGDRTYWNVLISNKLSNMTDTSESIPGLFKRNQMDLQLLLLTEGFCELTNQFRKVNFEDSPHEYSLTLSDRLVEMQKEEKAAKMAQRGPKWEPFASEFQSHKNIYTLRNRREAMRKKIFEMFKNLGG